MKSPADKDIHELLPHREPFLFIDKVISISSKGVTASKHVKRNEEYFKGHFPGNPLVPGVLIVESMAQAGGIACSAYAQEKNGSAAKEQYFLSRILDVKFKHPVFPEKDLIIKARVLDCFDSSFKVQVECESEGKMVAEGEIVLTKQKGGAA